MCWGGTDLTHWGPVTHICVSKLTIIGSDNGLSPGRRQAIIWTNARILLIRTSGTKFSEILSEMHTFSFKKMLLKMSSGKWRPFCLGLNELSAFHHPTCESGAGEDPDDLGGVWVVTVHLPMECPLHHLLRIHRGCLIIFYLLRDFQLFAAWWIGNFPLRCFPLFLILNCCFRCRRISPFFSRGFLYSLWGHNTFLKKKSPTFITLTS